MTIETELKIEYGYNIQSGIWIEELAELIMILQKRKNKIPNVGFNSKDIEIIDEIADVEFCLDQMKSYFDSELIEERKQFKRQRTKERFL